MPKPRAKMTPAQRARLRRAVERQERETGKVTSLILELVRNEEVAPAAIARELGVSRQAIYKTVRIAGE